VLFRILWMALAGLAATEPAPGAPAPATTAPKARVILMGAQSAEAEEGPLSQAIRAQLVDVDIELVDTPAPDPGENVAARIQAATVLIEKLDALGAWWVEIRPDELLLYLVDRHGAALARRIERDPRGEGAELEALAVIVRASTQALLEGRTIGMQRVPAAPEPAPERGEPPTAVPEPEPTMRVDRRPHAPTRLPHPHGGLSVAYAGTSFAAEPDWGARWQSGLTLWTRWHPRAGPVFVGAGYTFYQELVDVVEPSTPSLGFDALFAIRRHPARAFVGHRLARAAISLDSEIAVVVDATTVRGTPQRSLEDFENRVDIGTMVGLEPRLRLHVRVHDLVTPFVALGAEIMVKNVRYDVTWMQGDEIAEQRTYLRPHPVRPTLAAGLSFWLPSDVHTVDR
jgi:hypothetical protein